MSEKKRIDENYITNKYHGNPFSIIRDESCVSYGTEKRCKRCDKKLNYINKKVSKYCHACKIKVLAEEDMADQPNMFKSYKNKISGEER